ncbi:MAG TPA: glycosyltransferase family 2 protein [bacterium]|nr:glycosyltransferase family 2 protein [bacterium]HPQ19841.1 glycosyltransferase family 2 protein [bacterium]
MKTIEVIIPVYNESENIKNIYTRLCEIFNEFERYKFNIIFVNDASSDNSEQLIKEIIYNDDRVKCLNFARNFGQQAAYTAGLDFSSGDAVILMDCDLQDPPELLKDLVKKWEEGYEVVYCIRRKRNESLFLNISYKCYYKILSKLANINIPKDTGDFSLIDSKLVEIIKKLPERNRFLRGLRAWVGFKQIGIEYERPERAAGEKKYNLIKLIKLGLDGIFSFSYFPLKIFFFMGLFFSLLSGLGIIFILIGKLFFSGFSVVGHTTTYLLILIFSSIQLFCLAIIGEYISRIYDEVKGRPNYILKEKIGFKND